MQFFAFLASLLLFAEAGFHEECHETLRTARARIENVADSLANREISRLVKLMSKSKSDMKEFKPEKVSYSPGLQDLIRVKDDQQPCPQPNATMFTTSTPSTTTQTTTTTGPSTSSGAQTDGTAATSSQGTTQSEPSSSTSAASSTAAPMEENEVPKPKNLKFKPSKVYVQHTKDQDPFAWYMKTLHYYMKRESEVCNNQITDLNSVTEDQLFGYFSTLASAHPGPFCSLCHRFTEEIHQRVLRPNQLLITDDEYHISNLFYSHFPSPKSICTAIAPGCDDNYAAQVRNLTESVVCLECTACMSVTNVLQHKILLQPAVLDSVYAWLRGNLFHNLCAELCLAFQPYNITLFPNGFSYDGCQNVMKKKFYQLIDVATVIMRPERFCSLELQWCELNEQPNALHCLRELCQEYFQNTPQTRWLCSQIPDRPDQADAFLNIRQTKVRKEKKEYHVQFEQRNLHDEL